MANKNVVKPTFLFYILHQTTLLLAENMKWTGEQGQIDWKEDISIANKYREIFVINVLHFILNFSRYSYLELSVQKRLLNSI